MTDKLAIFDIVLKCVIAFAAATWAVWNYLHSLKKERTKVLTELYAKYHSKDMIQLRSDLWVRIDVLNEANFSKSFAALWTELDDQGRIKEMAMLTALYEFGAFWNGLSAVHKNKLLSKPLAKDFFGYQYSYWKYHLAGLIKQTLEMDTDRPDILKAFTSGDLDWLEFHDPDIKLYHLRK